MLLALALAGCAGAPGLNLASLGGTPAAEDNATGKGDAKPAEKPAADKAAAAENADGKDKAERKTAKSEPVPAAAPKAAVAAAPEPKEVRVALVESRKLKAAGKPKEALAVLDKAAKTHPSHRALAVEQGLISLELGQAADAQKHLSKTDPADAKDWRALSGLGIAHASQGQQAEAQRYFKKALEIDPSNPTLMNNLAMSLILDRKIDEAEALLRKAPADVSTKQLVQRNLALAQSLKAQQERQASSAGAPQSATP